MRADPGLALTAYGTENGTASGTTSTSAGNVFVSQFTGAANQLWKIESGGIQLFPTIDIRKETGKSMEYYENRNWYSFCCPVTNFGDTVTWSSSNTQSLIVDNVGRVSSLTAGESVLRATVRHADGTYDYYTITFYVTIPEGTYYLNDKANNYRLEYESLISLSENAILESFNSGTDEPTSRGRFYKIKYLGDGLYSIRSLLDCSMGWTRSNTSLVMTTIGPLDKNIPDTAKWRIKSNANGYYIHSEYGTSRTVTAGSSSGVNISLQSYSSTNTRQNWEIKKITKSYHGVTVKNAAGTAILGEDQQFVAAVYSTYTDVNGQKGVTWSVTNGTGSASIVPATGVLTGLTQGTVTVKVTFKPNSYQSWTDSCMVTIIPIEEKTYFIQNRHYGKYIQVDNDDAPNYSKDGGLIEQFGFDGEYYQRWIFTHVGNGYYRITSAVSGHAVTIPSGKETTDAVDLILTPYIESDNQKWKIVLTSHGSYKIKAKSSEGYTSKDLVMRVNVQGLHTADGLNIQQRAYSNDADYKDEWIFELEDTFKITLCGISNSGHNHSSCLKSVRTNLHDADFNNIKLKTGAITSADCLDYLKNSNVFTSRSHGHLIIAGVNGPAVSTGIILNDEEGTNRVGLYSHSWTGMTSGSKSIASTDSFAGMNLVLFIGCETARDGASGKNLPSVVVNQGAEVAIGFSESINCSEANIWTIDFYSYLLAGHTVQSSVDYASNNRSVGSGLRSAVVCGNGNYKISK